MSFPLQRIGMQARAEMRLFMVALARRLHGEFGSEIHLYCSNAEQRDYYAKRGADVFASITLADHLLKSSRRGALDEGRVIAQARTLEARFGTTYNSLAVSHRHFGRGYALGGIHHPRSPISEGTDYLHIVQAYNEALTFWDREIQEKDLTLILNGGREAALVGRANDVPFRTFAGSRYKNYHYWAWNEFWENPEFEDAYNAGIGQAEPIFDVPIYGYAVNRHRFLRRTTLYGMARAMALRTARQLWWTLRGYEKRRGYYLRDDLRYFLRLRRQWSQLKRIARARLSDLKGRRFVFMPLQTEPEYALQGLSPEFFDQLGAVAALSRDLPAGVRLAVKETYWGVGRRPVDYYRQLAAFKNVVLLDPLEPGIECVRRADAVALITGSAGFEAAVLGKPVVTFGQHNIFNFLPHVRLVGRDGGPAQLLRDALDGDFDASGARAAGKRFLNAVIACSFDMRTFDFVRQEAFEDQVVAEAQGALVRSLSAGEEAMRAAR